MSILVRIPADQMQYTDMHTNKWCKNPPTKVAETICKVMSDKGISSPKELADVCGMNQPTVQRILSGQIKNPSPETLMPFLKRFRLSYAQVIGEDFYAPANPDERMSAKAEEIAKKWERLNPEGRRCVSMMVDVLLGKTNKQKVTS